MAKVLVVDDEQAICEAFKQFLTHDGHEAIIAANGEEALDMIQSRQPDAVFLDNQMPGMDGLETLKRIHNTSPHLPVILMTAYGTMQTAINAVHEGAFDYLGKPVELAQVRETLKKALHQPAIDTRIVSPVQAAQSNEKQLIGQSAVMQEIFKLMGLLTTNDMTVLIMGESGVGKELVAQGIHKNSPRKDQPYIAVNCAAIPENLFESELFGHEKGAFTGAHERRIGRFEAASKGTLFLDEITELPLHLQSKLLRVLQEHMIERVGSNKPVSTNARLIVATNKDLEQEVKAGRFREDLFYRLKLATLTIPPLRERKDDITTLAQYFLHNAASEMNKPIEKFEDRVLERLLAYHWPGNVRELENTIKRSMLTARGDTFTVHDLDLAQAEPSELAQPDQYQELNQTLNQLFRAASDNNDTSKMFDEITHHVEQELIELALKACNNNQVAASKMLGIHRTTLRKKMRTE